MEVTALLVACAAVASGTDTLDVWLGCVLGWSLLTIGWIDAEHMRLPDALTLPLLLVGLASAVTDPEMLPARVVGAVVGYLAFQGVAWAYRLVRGRAGLGGGDAKLLAVAGAWLGWQPLPLVVLFAALSALAWATWLYLRGQEIGRKTRLPFGPFLALSTWAIWLCSSNLDFALGH
jgi:leader peptidase (prepilin peptidase)/N-methyltransferase